MKLSDIKGERVLDVVADIVDPIASIAEDEDASELFAPKALPDDMTPWTFFLSRVRKSLPPLIRKHKDEFVAIMATIEGITPKEYMDGLSLGKLFKDLTDLVTDTEFASFFLGD